MHELIDNLKNIYNNTYFITNNGLILKKNGEIFRNYVSSVKYITKGKNGFIFKVIINNSPFCFKITLHGTNDHKPYEVQISEKMNEISNLKVRKYYASISGSGIPKLNEDNVFNHDLIYAIRRNKPYSNVSIYEWIDGIELLKYVELIENKNKDYDVSARKPLLTKDISFKDTTLLLQSIIKEILLTLDILQKNLAGFRHNDLHLQNILIIPEQLNDIPYLIDFDYASCLSLPNPKINESSKREYGITDNGNSFYDIHYLLNLLLHNKYTPLKIKNLIRQVIPETMCGSNKKNILKNYRLLINHQVSIEQIINVFISFNG